MQPLITEISTTYNGKPGGQPRAYGLGQRTLVIGPTGSGKTSLLASIGLLLTGHADDAIGRQSVAASNDLQLAMDEEAGQNELQIKGTLADATVISYDLTAGKAALAYDKRNPWRHPVRAIRDILAKGVEPARAELAPLILGGEPIELHRVIPRTLHAFVPEMVQIEELTALVAKTETEFKAHDKRRKTLEAESDAASRVLPNRPAPEALEALRRLGTAYGERVRGAAYWTGIRDTLQADLNRLLTLQNELQVRAQFLVEEVKTLPEQAPAPEPLSPEPVETPFAEPAPTPPFDEGQMITLRAYGRILSFAQPGVCPCCQQGADTVRITANVKAYTDRISAYEAASLAWESRRAAHHEAFVRELDMWRAREAARVFDSTGPVRTKADARREYAEIAEQFKGLPPAIAEAQEKLSRHVAAPPEELGEDPVPAYEAARGAEALWQNANAKNAERLQAAELASRYEALGAELVRALDLTYQQRISAFVSAVDRWMPRGYGIHVKLHGANGRRIFRFGLRTPDGLALNPSGGQRLTLLLALVSWLVSVDRLPGSPGKTGPVIVMPPEERSMSADWLGKVMTALAESPAQIVLVSMVKPTGYRGKAWTIVDLKATGAGASGGAGSGSEGENAQGELPTNGAPGGTAPEAK